MEEKKVRDFIFKELSNFEFKKFTKGFKYLTEAIFICINDVNALDNLNKNVYPIIADKFNEASIFNVKWCIEQVVKTMYNNTHIHILCNYFDIDECIKPSLKFIIYTIVCKYYKLHS